MELHIYLQIVVLNLNDYLKNIEILITVINKTLDSSRLRPVKRDINPLENNKNSLTKK